MSASKIIKKHGPRGYFVRSLYRMGMLGWVLFLITLMYLMVQHFVASIWPQPTLMVNERGEIIGKVNFNDELTRNNTDFINAGKAFIGYYYPFNSTTIFEDRTQALALMTDALREKEITAISSAVDDATGQPLLKAIEERNIRSFAVFDKEDGVTLESKKDGVVYVRYRGNLVYIEGKRAENTFDVTLAMKPARRHNNNYWGVEIDARIEN